MALKIAAELTLSVLAVFGAYALFRILVTARFLPEKSGLFIKIPKDASVLALPRLLQSARLMAGCLAGGRVICLLEAGVDERVKAYLRQEGIRYYSV